MNPAPPVTRSRPYAAVTLADGPLDRTREATGVVVVAGQLGRPDQGSHGAGIGPLAFVDPGEEPPIGDVVVENVGDLEFTAPRRCQTIDHGECVRPEKVDPDRDEVALRYGGFLLEGNDSAGRVKLGDAESLRIGDPVQKRACAPRPGVELASNGLEGRPAEDVVAKDAAERVVADEAPGEPDGVGDPVGAVLVAIRQVETEVRAVREQLNDVADALAADDDENLLDAHARQGLDRVVDHRPVIDRQEVLVRDDREREQSRRGPAGEDDALHAVTVAEASGASRGWLRGRGMAARRPATSRRDR